MAITSTTDGRIEAVEGIICYLFTNKALLREALQAAGCYSAAAPYRIDGNKDLALVGDAALRLALVSDGYDKHACRGRINNVVSATGSNANLAQVGFRNSLDQYIYINPSQAGVSKGVMATTVEAILGAVYKDSNADIQIVRKVAAVLGLSWPALTDDLSQN